MDKRQTCRNGRKARPAAWAAVLLLSALPLAAQAARRMALGVGRSACERATSPAPPGNGAQAVGWACLLLVLLLPEVAWGQQDDLMKILEAQRDGDAWQKVVDCKGADQYLEEWPEGLHAKEARKCLEAGQVERLLEACEEHLAAGRLSRGLGGTAVDCYKEVLSMDPGSREALSGLRRVMEEYERRAGKALKDGNVERAKGYVERMAELSPESREVMELEDAIADAERKAAEERRRAEAERKAKEEAEARRQAEAERKAREAEERRRVEAEAQRRAEAEALRKAREAEEDARRRRVAEEDSYWKKCERNDEARYCEEYLSRYGDGVYAPQARQRLAELDVPPPGKKFRDCPGCPEMVVVPAGSFMMGSPESESGRWDNEGPEHRVTIGYRFAVGVYEVTRGEFARFVSETGRSMGDSCRTYEGGEWKARSGRNWKSPGYSQTDAHPVVCVNWRDADAYVDWLSGETKKAYRLLSEAEWEYVARAGTKTARYWGESESGQCRYANGADETYGWSEAFCDDGYARTAPVGSYQANGFGLRDVLGNVWEWTEDCWNGSYAGAPRDGGAWESGDCNRRVLRGGSWVSGPRSLRSAVRYGLSTGDRDIDAGFRVARTLTP